MFKRSKVVKVVWLMSNEIDLFYQVLFVGFLFFREPLPFILRIWIHLRRSRFRAMTEWGTACKLHDSGRVKVTTVVTTSGLFSIGYFNFHV